MRGQGRREEGEKRGGEGRKGREGGREGGRNGGREGHIFTCVSSPVQETSSTNCSLEVINGCGFVAASYSLLQMPITVISRFYCTCHVLCSEALPQGHQ